MIHQTSNIIHLITSAIIPPTSDIRRLLPLASRPEQKSFGGFEINPCYLCNPCEVKNFPSLSRFSMWVKKLSLTLSLSLKPYNNSALKTLLYIMVLGIPLPC